MRIFKYLKGHTAAVLVVLVLLVGEAFCDLALPTYTGNIVNVGIQQSGIENASPDVMTARTFDDVAMLMSADDENLLRASYTLGDDGLYRLNDTGKADRTALDSAIALPLVVADRGQLAETSADAADAATEATGAADAADSGTASAPRAEAAAGAPVSLDQSAADDAAGASAEDAESDAAGASAAAMPTAFGSAQTPSLAALESAYAQGLISKDQIADLLSQVAASLGGSDDLIAQQAVASAGSELERAGVDLASVQMSYLLRTGLTMMGFVLASAVLASVMGLLASRVGAGVGRELRGKLYRRVMTFSDAEVQKFSAASLITRATNDVQQIQNMTVMLLRMMLYAPILAAGGVIMIVRDVAATPSAATPAAPMNPRRDTLCCISRRLPTFRQIHVMALGAVQRRGLVRLVAVGALNRAVLVAGMRVVLGIVAVESPGAVHDVVPVVAAALQAGLGAREAIDVGVDQVPVSGGGERVGRPRDHLGQLLVELGLVAIKAA